MTRHLVERGVFRDDPFSLVDVGCSGGIPEQWRHFEDQIQAVGFDPLIREIERLNASKMNPSVRYVAARVGCRAFQRGPKAGLFNTDSFPRCTTVRAVELMRIDYANTYFDQTHDGAQTPEMVELDEFFREHPCDVDFLKTDVDGFDIEALAGARELLSGAGPIGVQVETQFGGWPTSDANLFSNVDPYLRGLGYSLFAMDPKLHSKAALPKMFRWSQPADTHEGQSCWSDSLYFRDVCLPGYEDYFRVRIAAHKLLKLCCAFEIHGLEDCAAEVLLQFRRRLEGVVDVDRCLDLLTPPLPDGRQVPYREYIDFFEKNVTAFYSRR
ncbi:MAG TPA: FkbM family methyltransferase [Bryobacteraceae bacterium]|nr:FkbM family methyltransferase [Bryobacteraceae bacterium]